MCGRTCVRTCVNVCVSMCEVRKGLFQNQAPWLRLDRPCTRCSHSGPANCKQIAVCLCPSLYRLGLWIARDLKIQYYHDTILSRYLVTVGYAFLFSRFYMYCDPILRFQRVLKTKITRMPMADGSNCVVNMPFGECLHIGKMSARHQNRMSMSGWRINDVELWNVECRYSNTSARRLANEETMSKLQLPNESCIHRAYVEQKYVCYLRTYCSPVCCRETISFTIM